MATLSDVREQANAELAAGHHERALSLAALIQRHFPRDYQSYHLLGRVFLETQEMADSRQAFETVLQVDPEDLVCRSALAMVAEIQDNAGEALVHFQRALEIDPENLELASDVARLTSALDSQESAVPGSSAHSMARRCLARGENDDAVTWFMEARRTSPDLPEIVVGLARALWLAWRPREAEGIAREILSEYPDCLRALAIVAGSVHSSGSEEALDYLVRTAELDPGNHVARELFVQAGLRFPEREAPLEIPDNEVEAVLSVSTETPPPDAPGSEEPSPPGPAPEREAFLGASEEPVLPVGEETPSPVSPVGMDELLDPVAQPGQTSPNGVAGEQETELALAEEDLDDAPDGSDDAPDGSVEADAGMDEGAGAPFEGKIGASEVAAGRAELLSRHGVGSTDSETGDLELASGPSAADRMAAAAGYARRGLAEKAFLEYRAALKSDPALAPDVAKAAVDLADATPGDPRFRWLAGDAFARTGQFSRAAEQYMMVLKKD